MQSVNAQQLLTNIQHDVRKIIQICRTNFSSLSFEQINRKHPTEAWSIADCLEHLNDFCRYYLPATTKVVEEGIAQKIPFEEMHQSNQIGLEAMASVHPQHLPAMRNADHFKGRDIQGRNNEKVLEEFLSHQENLLTLLEKAHNTSLTKLEVPVRNKAEWSLRLGDCFPYLVRHEVLHIMQSIELYNEFS